MLAGVRQIVAVTAMGLRAIPDRLGASLVIVIGMALVVAVSISILSMSVGFMRTVYNTGRIDRAIVLSHGSQYEFASAISRDNVLTIADIERLGLEKTAEIALDLAWKDADAVYVSFDVDSVDCGFVPGTGWPEPGGFLPREALKLLGLVAAEGVCGLEVVEVSPPYDTSDITALVGVRVVVEVLGSLVAHGKLGSHKPLIDKPVTY